MDRMYEQAKRLNNEHYENNSKKRLIKAIEKKAKTSMIGTLARCEENLGFLWGHDLDEEELTREQLKYADIWENLRTEILNHCNSQLRAMIEEISQYTIKWDQYKIDFIIKKDR